MNIGDIEAWLKSLVREAVEEIVEEKLHKYLGDPKPEQPRYYTVREVCAKMDICQATFYNILKRFQIPTYKKGTLRLVDARTLDDMIETGELRKYSHKRKPRYNDYDYTTED